MTFVLGLTGSIGMGKSTTAQMFADEGVPVWDADATVAKLYAAGGAAAKVLGQRFPEAMDGASVSREKLREMIAKDPSVLDEVQTLVHPLVAANRAGFLRGATAPIVLLDIPLLFETGVDATCDGVVVVSVPEDIQRERVLARGGMSKTEFEMILSRQMPDVEKRARARWVIATRNLDATRAYVRNILDEIEKEISDA